MTLVLSAACGCNIGRHRRNNEDNFYFDGRFMPENNSGTERILTCRRPLGEETMDFAVFDGMGGQADGQVASCLAASVFAEEARKRPGSHEQFLHETMVRMSEIVSQRAQSQFNNMGTTAAALRFAGSTFYLSNIGDSRIFLFRNEMLQQISVDHTDEAFMRSLGIKDRKPRLTQYVGVPSKDMKVQPYLAEGETAGGDVFLICSDGLTDMVSPEQIAAVLSAHRDCAWTVNELIGLALNNGGIDNVTVIVIQAEGSGTGGEIRPVMYDGGAPDASRLGTLYGNAQNSTAPAFEKTNGADKTAEKIDKPTAGLAIAVAAAASLVIILILVFMLGLGRKPQGGSEEAGTTATSGTQTQEQPGPPEEDGTDSGIVLPAPDEGDGSQNAGTQESGSLEEDSDTGEESLDTDGQDRETEIEEDWPFGDEEEPEQAETPAAENEGSHSSVQEKMEENLQEMYKFPENQDPDIPDSGADNGTPGNDTGESSESRQGGQGSIDRRESGRGGPNVR